MKIILTTAAALLAGASFAMAADLDVRSAIESVVVYPDGATVTRTIRVDLPRGDATLIARDFPLTLAAGIVSWFGLQTLINLGAVTGLLPVTGVPLPFLSYGGSSLVVSLAAVGVLVSIARAPASGYRSSGRPGSRATTTSRVTRKARR